MIEAVDDGLSSLGDQSKQALYFHLEKTFKIRKQDIPEKIEEFTNAIERIFGEGAKLLEIEIMRQLHKKVQSLQYPSEKNNLFFLEYIESAQDCTDSSEKKQHHNLLYKLT